MKYQLINTSARKKINLKKYKRSIENAVSLCTKEKVRVDVFKDYYRIYGTVTNGERKQIGKCIANTTDLRKFCRRYGNSVQIFRCVDK